MWLHVYAKLQLPVVSQLVMVTMQSTSSRCTSASDGESRRSASDSETSPSESPPIPKGKKKQRHTDSKYHPEWSVKCRGIKPSKKGSTYAFCSLCGVDISIAGGGVHQIKRHCDNKKHCSRVKEVSRQPTISTVVGS